MIAAWVAAALCWAPPQDPGEDERPLDVVVLKDGSELEGHVLREGDQELLLLVGTRERTIPAAEVGEVRSVARSLALVLEQYTRTEITSVLQVLDLARFARARGLEGLAEIFALRALESQPESAAAHEFLGHRLRSERWYASDGSRSLPFEELRELRKDWGSPWEVATPHYALRSNLPLGQVLDVAMDLELFYQAFYARFGDGLELREIVRPMPVHVHADGVSFPDLVGNRMPYFDPGLMTVIVTAEAGYLRDLLIHEATHQLLYATAVSAEHSPRAKGCLPGWLDEGLACWFEVIQTGPPGRAEFDDRRRSAYRMAIHRSAERPYDLSRVLTFGTDDFHATSNLDLKYAQCYTLVEFFLRGDYFAHRDSFFAVLRSAYGGNCSSQDVRQALTVTPEEFERAWEAYVGQ
jgi:hypothetical protein